MKSLEKYSGNSLHNKNIGFLKLAHYKRMVQKLSSPQIIGTKLRRSKMNCGDKLDIRE